MLSFPKLLILGVILGAVWYGFKFIGRMKDRRDAELRADKAAAKRADTSAARQAVPDTEDMVACPTCGTFVAVRNTTACGRGNCPY